MRILLVDVSDDLAAGLTAEFGAPAVCQFGGDLLDTEAPHAAGYDLVIHGLGVGSDDEDKLIRSTLGTWNLVTTLDRNASYLQLSSMKLFAGYEAGWAVTEEWLPRPATDATTLACYLGELTSQELARIREISVGSVRIDDIVSPEEFEAGPVGPQWLHQNDAVAGVVSAARHLVGLDPALGGRDDSKGAVVRQGRWTPIHVVRGGGRYQLAQANTTCGFTPTFPAPDPTPVADPAFPAAPPALSDLPTPQRITVYGAGGPIGTAAVNLLLDRAFVRATDVRSLAELVEAPAQSPGAPTPTALPSPHEYLPVDVTNGAQVRAAARGADCLVNVSVLRADIRLAFAVNMLGAWHIMQAAIAEGIKKVVFTGPSLSIADFPFARWDRGLDGTQHLRGGDWVYLLTKKLGMELTRLLANEHQIAAPALLYVGFASPERNSVDGTVHDFSVSWPDSGRSIVAAIDVASLPEPSPAISILSRSPHDRWTTDRAREILGWEATDDLSIYWKDSRVSNPHNPWQRASE